MAPSPFEATCQPSSDPPLALPKGYESPPQPAHRYAALADVDAESSAMAVAGGRLVGIHWMHDTRDEV